MSKSDLLREFLSARRWTIGGRTDQFLLYAPPTDLGLAEEFRLALPQNPEAVGAERALQSLSSFIGELYHIDSADLLILFGGRSRVLSVRVADEDVSGGTMRLESFDALVSHLQGVVLQAANYAYSGDPLLTEDTIVGKHYLRHCRVLQTREGSFITRIEIPDSGSTEANPSLFHKEKIDNSDVANRVRDSIRFASDTMFSLDQHAYEPEYLDAHRHITNARLLKNLLYIFSETELRCWEFRFAGIRDDSVISFPEVTPAMVRQAKKYLKFVIDTLKKEELITAEGMVVELRSRDPRRGRGLVRMEVFVKHRQLDLVVSLGPFDYAKALEAHSAGRIVRVVGSARAMQTYHKIDDPAEFTIL